jgi:hypothetical protein
MKTPAELENYHRGWMEKHLAKAKEHEDALALIHQLNSAAVTLLGKLAEVEAAPPPSATVNEVIGIPTMDLVRLATLLDNDPGMIKVMFRGQVFSRDAIADEVAKRRREA